MVQSNCKLVVILTGSQTLNDILGALLGAAPWLAGVFLTLAVLGFLAMSKSERFRTGFFKWFMIIICALLALSIIGSIVGVAAPNACVPGTGTPPASTAPAATTPAG